MSSEFLKESVAWPVVYISDGARQRKKTVRRAAGNTRGHVSVTMVRMVAEPASLARNRTKFPDYELYNRKSQGIRK
jgi:hypothetical protein